MQRSRRPVAGQDPVRTRIASQLRLDTCAARMGVGQRTRRRCRRSFVNVRHASFSFRGRDHPMSACRDRADGPLNRQPDGINQPGCSKGSHHQHRLVPRLIDAFYAPLPNPSRGLPPWDPCPPSASRSPFGCGTRRRWPTTGRRASRPLLRAVAGVASGVRGRRSVHQDRRRRRGVLRRSRATPRNESLPRASRRSRGFCAD